MQKKLTGERIHKRDEGEILYGKITVLEKENQCLMNEVKNQQAVIEMIIIGGKCRKEWKVVNTDKSEKNTNKTSAYSIPSKVPSPVNLQN